MRKGAKRILWTAHEDIILEDHYPAGGALACQPHLPDRTRSSISTRAALLGLHHRVFYRDDALILLERKSMTGYEVGKRLGKHPSHAYQLLERLERAGVVRRVPYRDDKPLAPSRRPPAFLYELVPLEHAAD